VGVAARLVPAGHGSPAFLAAGTGRGFAYRRPDGVFVVPIGALAA